jgi:hypothetical protein
MALIALQMLCRDYAGIIVVVRLDPPEKDVRVDGTAGDGLTISTYINII